MEGEIERWMVEEMDGWMDGLIEQTTVMSDEYSTFRNAWSAKISDNRESIVKLFDSRRLVVDWR